MFCLVVYLECLAPFHARFCGQYELYSTHHIKLIISSRAAVELSVMDFGARGSYQSRSTVTKSSNQNKQKKDDSDEFMRLVRPFRAISHQLR